MTSTAADSAMTALRVARTEEIAQDIHLFELRRDDHGALPPFTAGAHVSVRTPSGLIRKYSLSNDPAESDRYVIAVRRETGSRGGSASMASDLKAGDELLVSEPRNDFPLVKSPAGYTFIAGGIGITPIIAMMRYLKSSGGGRFKLYYLTRNVQATAFRDDLSGPEFKGQVMIHNDEGDPARAFDLWPVLEQPRGHVYCCGPRGLMEAVRDMTGHWSSSAVHFEAFAEADARRADDKPFRVRLARSDVVLDVPAGTTILEAMRARGFDAPSSCESGTCGTCRTRLISGAVDHRDLVLADQEKTRNIMICVSRGASDEIVIDR
jgi:phthalate 4,5-dioxygenase reductase component